MHKQTIIQAIQEQQKISIYFKKETDGQYVQRKVSPYDVFPQVNSKSKREEDILFGYADGDVSHRPHPVSIYLKTIQRLSFLEESFSGPELRWLLKPKERPNISRNW